jgi:GDP-4-dehydro-6-deoxy-D-mannose reductase
MARTIVTGAAGFIGQALVPALAAAGHAVVPLARTDGDVADAATWERLPAVDHVFHLAALSYVPDSWDDPAGFLATNVGGTTRALDYCRQNGAHLVFVSAYVYGVPQRLPIREDDPAAPNNPYALSKFLAEQVCAFHAAEMKVPVTVVRPFNIFGPGQRPEFLIPTILAHVRRGETIRVKDLTPRRDYLFVDDLVAALLRTIERPHRYRPFNLGSGVSHSVQEIIDIIQAAAGTQLPVVSADAPRANEIPDVRADITCAHEQLGWTPRVTFAEGIARLVQAD